MRRCPGHRFRAFTFDGVPLLGRWKCAHCRALEGMKA